jgi:hypothetical protein
MNESNNELREKIAERVAAAERCLIRELQEDLYRDVTTHFSPKEREAFAKRERIRKLSAPYRWIKYRALAVIAVLRHGECGMCEHDEY